MTTKPEPDPLLRPVDVARRLGVVPYTLRKLVTRGEFPEPDVKAGMRIVRWKESTLNNWVDTQRSGAWKR